MVKSFSVPFNIPKGTAVADGYRIAPEFSTLGTTGVDARGLLISDSSYKNYGSGMLMTPFNTWNITPYLTQNGNVVATTQVLDAGWLTLFGDNGATTLVASNNTGMFPKGAPNNFYLQLDWPRVPEISVVGANFPGAVNVTFFGFDWYDRPLQHTYTVQDIGRYPGPLYNLDSIKGKAFYRITGVYFNGATPGGGTINCQVSNTFGLPYVLKSYNDVSLFGWNDNDMRTQGGVATLDATGTIQIDTPVVQAIIDARAVVLNATNNFQAYGPQISLSTLTVGGTEGFLHVDAANASTQAAMGNFGITSSSALDTSRVSWSIPNGGKYLLSVGDGTTPTAFTGDVRGLFELPGLQGTGTVATETWGALPDGTKKAIFTYYCEGFDEWLTILNAGGQPQFNGVVNPPSTNNITPPNLVKDMFGLNQYYTGIPA